MGILRALRVLSENESLDISELCSKTNMNHASMSTHVEKLIETNPVLEKRAPSAARVRRANRAGIG